MPFPKHWSCNYNLTIHMIWSPLYFLRVFCLISNQNLLDCIQSNLSFYRLLGASPETNSHIHLLKE